MGDIVGEAKRHAKLLASMNSYCRPMSRHRFNLYAIGTRKSPLYRIFEELSWWCSPNEDIIAAAGKDQIDNDFSWTILVRDRIKRFRAVRVDTSYPTLHRAEEALWKAMADTQERENLLEIGRQGDEPNSPIDLLRVPDDMDDEKLHPYFRVLLNDPGRAPARAVIKEIGPWLTPQDPHMVGEFQTTSFDQRLWEIYLWAAFRDFGLDVEQLEAPDFRCTAPGIDFTVEATTAAPSTMGPLASHPDPQTAEEIEQFLRDYMPMKFGSALASKLNKKNKSGLHYCELENSKDKPFVIAIADFHMGVDRNNLGSMTFTQSALWEYLYGRRVEWRLSEEGKLTISSSKIENHTFGTKAVPSGFFDHPLAVNVSAVIFSNAGTIAKFDRMGIVAGFTNPRFKYYRMGRRQNPDPNAVMGIPFDIEVSAPGYEEYWSDEIQVFHNPNAKKKFNLKSFPGATHHVFRNGQFHSLAPQGAILSSFTVISGPYSPETE
jgi:hypothetical protein